MLTAVLGVSMTLYPLLTRYLSLVLYLARALDMGINILPSDKLPLLDEKTKEKPENLARDFGKLIFEADGFAQVFIINLFLFIR